MTIDEAISNVKSAMNAFPNQPDMVRLTIEHYNKLLELAPKTKATSAKAKPPVPKPEPKKEEEVKITIKEAKATLNKMCKEGGEEVRDKINELAKNIAIEFGYKRFPDIPESDQKALNEVLRKAAEIKPSENKSDVMFEELPETELTRQDVIRVFKKIDKEKAKEIRKEITGKDSLGQVTDPQHFKEMIDAARKVLTE